MTEMAHLIIRDDSVQGVFFGNDEDAEHEMERLEIEHEELMYPDGSFVFWHIRKVPVL